MKRVIAIFVAVVLLICGIVYARLPDYKVFYSISNGDRTERETRLDVIVYKFWDVDKAIKDIEEEHNRINGTPTELKMRLYHSVWEMQHSYKPFRTVEFDYRHRRVNNIAP